MIHAASPYPWIDDDPRVTDNFTLNNDRRYLEATLRAGVQNQLGSMIIDAGLEPLQRRASATCRSCYNEAGVVDPRLLRKSSPSKRATTPYFQDGRILLPPTFAFGNRVANAPPSLRFPGFMNVNRTQDFSISLTKLVGRAHVQGWVLPEPQLQSAESRRRRRFLVPGRRSALPTTRANPLDTGFGFANAALGVFTQLPAAVEVRRRQLHLRSRSTGTSRTTGRSTTG